MSLVRLEDSEEPESRRESKGKDYSIVILAKYFGSLLGIPFMTAAWAKGIALGHGAMGLPFYAGAVSFVSYWHFSDHLGCLSHCQHSSIKTPED
jgi:hypothetical protein